MSESTETAYKTGPLPITAVIPAKNEEVPIPGIIERTKPFADEILVVDGHSTDETVKVSEQAGARVVPINVKKLSPTTVSQVR